MYFCDLTNMLSFRNLEAVTFVFKQGPYIAHKQYQNTDKVKRNKIIENEVKKMSSQKKVMIYDTHR